MNLNRILRETFVAEAEHREQLGSTNDRCLERARQGATHLPLLVIADRQTAGRGRGANRWWTGPGCLAFSLLLESSNVEEKEKAMLGRQLNCRPNVIENRTNNLLGLAAGVAVVDTIKPLLQNIPLGRQLNCRPNFEIGIYWPNDVMADGRKLAGILVEVLPDRHAVVGFGINTNVLPSDVPADLQPVIVGLLELTRARCDHDELLVAVLNRLEQNIAVLKRSPAELATRANALCLLRGKPLTLRHDRRTVSGLCHGIAPDGALLLETSDGLRPYHSGQIVK
jgi:BirA family transcriptional regulator, biotin operon repressor / biotin---[acetyl-CoA-carboxylase] ligase